MLVAKGSEVFSRWISAVKDCVVSIIDCRVILKTICISLSVISKGDSHFRRVWE